MQLIFYTLLRSYVDKILAEGLIVKSGTKKATRFQINPQLTQNAKANIKTSLKTIEPYALKALIIEDVKKHPGTRISEIASRIPDVGVAEIRKMVYSMVDAELRTEGAKTNRSYFLISGIKEKK